MDGSCLSGSDGWSATQALYACGGYGGTGKVVGFLASRAVAELATTGRSDDVRLPALA